MKIAILVSLLAHASAWPAAAAEAGTSAAAGELAAAGAAADGRWADGQAAAVSATVAPGAEKDGDAGEKESVLPDSPAQAAAEQNGFMKGFAYCIAAAEWVPNLLANAVPVVGKPVGFILGLALLPIGAVAGLIGGLVTLIAGLF